MSVSPVSATFDPKCLYLCLLVFLMFIRSLACCHDVLVLTCICHGVSLHNVLPCQVLNIVHDNGDWYFICRSPDDGLFVVMNGVKLHNDMVVPYNPSLLLKYDCHFNVEVVSAIHSVKYLFKYVYKGHDKAMNQTRLMIIQRSSVHRIANMVIILAANVHLQSR